MPLQNETKADNGHGGDGQVDKVMTSLDKAKENKSVSTKQQLTDCGTSDADSNSVH